MKIGVQTLYFMSKITGICLKMKFTVITMRSNFAVHFVEVEKENGYQIFFNGEQPAKVVPPGMCFLASVQYDRNIQNH